MVRRPYCAACCLAISTARRISLTPASTAETVSKWASETLAKSRARVVLLTPVAPEHHGMQRALLQRLRNGLPRASRCSCPTYSSRLAAQTRGKWLGDGFAAEQVHCRQDYLDCSARRAGPP